MLDIFQPPLAQAEEYARQGNQMMALRVLRQLPVDDLGQLLLAVPDPFVALRSFLPRMAAEQVQIDWTGSCGEVLLAQTTAFVRALTSAYREYGPRELESSIVLDFGCGWGRILRLMLKYCEPDRLFGVDPWTRSLEICSGDGVLGSLALSDYVPDRLPFEGTNFDLVYAFSVFTHLSERTARKCLGTLRSRMTSKSLLALTIRPVEYWAFHTAWDKQYTAEQLIDAHQRVGYAFFPHNRPPIDGDVTYGDMSISLPYIAANWTEWEMLEVDRNNIDPLQVLIFLRPR